MGLFSALLPCTHARNLLLSLSQTFTFFLHCTTYAKFLLLMFRISIHQYKEPYTNATRNHLRQNVHPQRAPDGGSRHSFNHSLSSVCVCRLVAVLRYRNRFFTMFLLFRGTNPLLPSATKSFNLHLLDVLKWQTSQSVRHHSSLSCHFFVLVSSSAEEHEHDRIIQASSKGNSCFGCTTT